MLSRKAENYLAAIFDISQEKGYARIKDVATRVNVKPPSVTEMAVKLDRQNYVVYRKYEGITLTKKGFNTAKTIKDRHEMLKTFLKIIMVPEKVADKDAHKMETQLDEITTQKIKDFVHFLNHNPVYTNGIKNLNVHKQFSGSEVSKKSGLNR